MTLLASSCVTTAVWHSAISWRAPAFGILRVWSIGFIKWVLIYFFAASRLLLQQTFVMFGYHLYLMSETVCSCPKRHFNINVLLHFLSCSFSFATFIQTWTFPLRYQSRSSVGIIIPLVLEARFITLACIDNKRFLLFDDSIFLFLLDQLIVLSSFRRLPFGVFQLISLCIRALIPDHRLLVFFDSVSFIKAVVVAQLCLWTWLVRELLLLFSAWSFWQWCTL